MAKLPQATKVTFWQFLRDVFVASINKGQFPVAILGTLLIIYCIRVTPDILAELGRGIINSLLAGYFVGYAISVLAIGGWYFHAKSLRRKHYDELGRIADEKTELQKKQLGPTKVRSSKNR